MPPQLALLVSEPFGGRLRLDGVQLLDQLQADCGARVAGFDALEEAAPRVSPAANLDSVKGYEINPSGLLFSLSKVTVGQ